MRIAAFVLGMIFSFVVLFGSFIAACPFGLGVAIGEVEAAESFSITAGVGFIMAVLGIVGSALALKHPVASGVLLIIAAFFLTLTDMGVFGVIIGLAAILAFAGSKEKSTIKKTKRGVMG